MFTFVGGVLVWSRKLITVKKGLKVSKFKIIIQLERVQVDEMHKKHDTHIVNFFFYLFGVLIIKLSFHHKFFTPTIY